MDDRRLKEILTEQKKTNDLLISIECFLDGIYDLANKLTTNEVTNTQIKIRKK